MAKSAVILNFNDLLTPLYSTFEQRELTDITDEQKKPDCLITWTDFPLDSKMICLTALQNRVPTFMVQHGRRAMRDYWTHRGEPACLAAFVWGTKDKEDAIEGGWNPSMVIRVGAPWFHYRPEKQEEKGTIIYDVPHWNIDTVESKNVWKALNKIKGIRPIAKMIIPSNQKRENYEGEQCITYRGEPGHVEATYELIKRASAVVCMMEGTMELMAHSLGVPVIHVRGFKHKALEGTWQGVEDTLPGKGSIDTTLEKLPEAIELALSNPTVLAKEAKERLMEDAGDPDKDEPITAITAVIGALVDEHKKIKHRPLNIFDKEAHNEADTII